MDQFATASPEKRWYHFPCCSCNLRPLTCGEKQSYHSRPLSWHTISYLETNEPQLEISMEINEQEAVESMKRRRKKQFAYKPFRTEYELEYPNVQTWKAIFIFYLGTLFASRFCWTQYNTPEPISCSSYNSEPLYSPTSLYRLPVFLYQVSCSFKIVTHSLRISDILWLLYYGDLSVSELRALFLGSVCTLFPPVSYL